MRRQIRYISIFFLFFSACTTLFAQAAFAPTVSLDLLNHNKPMVDAHNCYPDAGEWADRLDRALGIGYPVGIEQDLAWGIDKATGNGRPVLSHSKETSGEEPTLREYFFEHVRPRIEQALRENNRAQWPLITVHFDFKDNRPELLHAVWDLLGQYETWITTAPKMADPRSLAPFSIGPLLVLTEENDAQERVFHTDLPVGTPLRLFGSAHSATLASASPEQRIHLAATASPEQLLTEKPTNYRRWWNNSWAEVEEGGQQKAGEWTASDDARLRALVNHAHQLGFWIRFYTLDGFGTKENRGWSQGYNFGTRESALLRWKAAIAAGVDLIATDQFEELASTWKRNNKE
ncbi:MAG: hypothetical protein ABL995_15300 [Bryobacteraceae bacterium]